MKSLSSLAPDRSIVEASPTGSTAKRGRFKWQGKIMAKKSFYLQNHPRVSITKSYFLTYRTIWKWNELGMKASFQFQFAWKLYVQQNPKINFEISSGGQPPGSRTRHELLMVSKSAREGIQTGACPYMINLGTSMYLDHVLSAMVLSNKFIALGF